MKKILGRIVSRGKAAGLFIPMQESLSSGLYQIEEIMGELTIKKLEDKSYLEESWPARYNAVDLQGLFNKRPSCCMTEAELVEAGQLGRTRDHS